ncbi:hypothetical protein BOTBODRAFT_38273 [Botryobasidium botryosum FD-172 SS1]|uniref:Uncharacterized protein n=1 Tax=Botryobasidium botryosum (strain FD-172 SS1) TaxID=930990 RepID=A0A067LXV2_BOTB1|nr:hypothetical protein BOTBODRAFT_38273 [Botryobasidium botryosum FD-172 SS1]
MPRIGRVRCAFDTDPIAPKRTAKPKVVLTDEEKAVKKEETLRRAQLRKKKAEWESALTEWKGAKSHKGVALPAGTKALFKSDAKKFYGLSDKDIAALPFQGFNGSSKQVIPLHEIEAHAKRKFEATGIPYEAMTAYRAPHPLTVNGPHLTNLSGRPDFPRRYSRY